MVSANHSLRELLGANRCVSPSVRFQRNSQGRSSSRSAMLVKLKSFMMNSNQLEATLMSNSLIWVASMLNLEARIKSEKNTLASTVLESEMTGCCGISDNRKIMFCSPSQFSKSSKRDKLCSLENRCVINVHLKLGYLNLREPEKLKKRTW